MFTITKEFAFEAAHHLTKVPVGHKCAREHGHSYRVVLELQSETLNEYGFVVDYNELSAVKDWLDGTFDHRDLNSVLREWGYPEVEPTAESLARFIFESWFETYPQLAAVRVSETAKTWAEYRKG